jgi:hypothetical protein
MAVLLLLLAAAFGAADQYLGSWAGHGWAVDTSLLAAPWLVLPFVIGCSQRSAQRAIALAVGCTFAALFGYIAMTLSPVEEAKVSLTGVLGLLRWQLRWFFLGAITAPLLGWLGHRWRIGAAAWAPVVPAAALVLEPFARTVLGPPIRSAQVRWLEVITGAVLAVLLLATGRAARMSPSPRLTGRAAGR